LIHKNIWFNIFDIDNRKIEILKKNPNMQNTEAVMQAYRELLEEKKNCKS